MQHPLGHGLAVDYAIAGVYAENTDELARFELARFYVDHPELHDARKILLLEPRIPGILEHPANIEDAELPGLYRLIRCAAEMIIASEQPLSEDNVRELYTVHEVTPPAAIAQPLGELVLAAA